MWRTPLDIAARGATAPPPGRTRGGGSRGMLPPTPSELGAGLGDIVVSPPTVERPPDAVDFNAFGTLAGRDNANTPAILTGADFRVPASNVAVIRSVSILANNLLTTSDILWALLVNSADYPGWDRLTINPRAAGSVEFSWTPEETFIPIPENALIQWRVTVQDAGTYQLSVAAHGWFYPTRIAGRFAGAYG